jgi:hypothetical protein
MRRPSVSCDAGTLRGVGRARLDARSRYCSSVPTTARPSYTPRSSARTAATARSLGLAPRSIPARCSRCVRVRGRLVGRWADARHRGRGAAARRARLLVALYERDGLGGGAGGRSPRGGRRRMSRCRGWCSLALGACAIASACDVGLHECASASCGGPLPEVALLDEAGNPSAARGEHRSVDARGEPATPFDCSPPDAGQASLCSEGVVLLSVFGARPGTRVELRFQLRDGSWSAWRALDLEITSHTDADFNGPGCPCTGYTATAAPIVVPAEARLPAP